MIQEKNPYDQRQWLRDFPRTPVYQRICDHYQHMIGCYRDMSLLRASLHHTVYVQPRDFCEQYRVLDAVPYYYLQTVMQHQPADILDLGCGLNIFKRAWPEIQGMDADPNSPCDVHDHFDEVFVAGHARAYDAVIAINSVHFAPIHTMAQRLIMVKDLIRPGGRAFVATNLETWLMHTARQDIARLFGERPQFHHVIDYANQQILSTGLDFSIVDWPILHITEESTIRDDCNGNIRLVFQVD